jgi:hypothetical protein
MINSTTTLSSEYDTDLRRNSTVWKETENALKCYKEVYSQKMKNEV